jgi:ribosomal protein S15P/S13E
MSNRRIRRGKSGTRKYGRNATKCQIYRSQKKREKSHIRRINKHLRRHPKDKQSKRALSRYEKLLRD